METIRSFCIAVVVTMTVLCSVLGTSDRAEAAPVRFYEDGSRITRVYGSELAVGIAPEDSAEQFRLAFANLLGVEPADLRPAGSRGEEGLTQPVMYDPRTGEYKFTLVTYEQHRAGIPVFRTSLKVLSRNADGFPVVLAASDLRDLGDFVPGPGPVIFDPATQAHTRMETFTDPETVIWAGVSKATVHPTVAVTFIGERGSPEAGDYEKWLFVADPTTGEMLYEENLIILTDVTGNVSGMATEGPKADFCAEEVLWAMPWATASIQGGNSTFTDANGDFTITNPGTSDVTIESPMNGNYFVVTDAAGPLEVLTQVVTPPGPANFTHNADNNDEFIRAQVNGYIQANVVRDFTLTYNPSYPTISTQTDFPVRVNRSDMYCPGNAWYDYSSINFCRAASGYPNTAYSGIVHHEYGHHMVSCAGSGQGQYGEGMGDCIGVLIADDPVGAWGFYGDCNSGLRNADNDYQYPCSGEIHDCGQLLSGCIWSTRNELAATYPGTYLDILSNLTVNSILLHTGTEITPQITIDFLTLDDDDGNIGNGTPHRTEICAGFGAHNMDCPPLETGLDVSPITGFDSAGPAGGPFTPDSMVYTVENLGDYSIDYVVTKSAAWLSLTNESGTLGPYASALVTVSINANADSLPIGKYTDVLTFTNTTDHVGDTTRDVGLAIGVASVVYEWTMDTDPGWTTEGLWAWGQPTGGGGQYGGPDPTSGYTGSNVYGYNLSGDYENYLAETHLTSSALDCTGLFDVTLKFQRWLGVEQPLYDHAYVRVSNDGSTWTTVWENTVEITDYAWVAQEMDISAVADGQPTVYLRWTMGSTDVGWQYCGWNIDDVQIVAIGGEQECTVPAECDDGLFCNGVEDCVDGFCVGGADPCPGQYCDEATDICVDCLSDGHCDDGVFCNGAETCVGGVCQAGTPVNCDDGVACTVDSCNETTDSCDNIPDDAACADALFCNGAEVCDPLLDCQPGGDPCPGQLCDEVNDICVDCFGDPDCDDGLWCNGGETCVGGSCQAGADPCPGLECDEDNDVCIACGLRGDPCVQDSDCCSGRCHHIKLTCK